MAPIQRVYIKFLKVRKLCMDEINVPTFPGKKTGNLRHSI